MKSCTITLLAVQVLTLLHDDENATDSYGEDKQHGSCHETEDAVVEDEACNGTSRCGCRPVGVASLQSEELQRTLQSLEDGKSGNRSCFVSVITVRVLTFYVLTISRCV